MLWLLWGISLVLLALSAWLMFLNWGVFWTIYVRKKHAPSWIPLLGGVLGAAALAINPQSELRVWWWVPFLVDWGCLPGLLYTLVWHLGHRTK